METIVKNEKYVIEVDVVKNRTYFTFIGFWESAAVVPNFLDDCRKAFEKISRGYSNLVNLSALKTPPDEIGALFIELQKMAMEYHPGKIAELYDSTLVKVRVEESTDASGIKSRKFDSMTKAVAWLDE